MPTVMICKQQEYKQERCWLCQERHFVVSVSEMQITPVTEAVCMDT